MSGQLIRRGEHRCNPPVMYRVFTKGSVWQCNECGKQYQWRRAFGWVRRRLRRLESPTPDT